MKMSFCLIILRSARNMCLCYTRFSLIKNTYFPLPPFRFYISVLSSTWALCNLLLWLLSWINLYNFLQEVPGLEGDLCRYTWFAELLAFPCGEPGTYDWHIMSLAMKISGLGRAQGAPPRELLADVFASQQWQQDRAWTHRYKCPSRKKWKVEEDRGGFQDHLRRKASTRVLALYIWRDVTNVCLHLEWEVSDVWCQLYRDDCRKAERKDPGNLKVRLLPFLSSFSQLHLSVKK